MKKSLIFWFTFLLILLLASCGTRKVEKSTLDVKKESEKQTTAVDNKVSEAKVEETNDITTDEFEIIPNDTTKPVEVIAPDGKITKFKNARITNKKTSDKSKVVSQEKVTQTTQIDATEKSNEITKVSEKKIERTSSYWWLLWFLLVIPIYLIWKNKEKFFV